MTTSPKTPHRRYNPLLDVWVLCFPHRLQRPWQGQVEDEARETRPEYDPSCYLCPGNLRADGERNPASRPHSPSTTTSPPSFPRAPTGFDEGGLLVAEPETGAAASSASRPATT